MKIPGIGRYPMGPTITRVLSVELRLAVDTLGSVPPQLPSRPGEQDQGSRLGELEQSMMG